MKKTKCPLFIFLVIFAYFDSHDLKRPDATNSKLYPIESSRRKDSLCIVFAL